MSDRIQAAPTMFATWQALFLCREPQATQSPLSRGGGFAPSSGPSFSSSRSKRRICGFAPGGFLVRSMGFVSEHPRLGPAALLALLSAYLLDSGYLRRHLPGLFLLNFVEQYTPGNKPIESLLTSCLALHLQAGWPVEQHYARRRFIDILTAMPSRSDKSFFNIGLTHPQGSHPLGKLL